MSADCEQNGPEPILERSAVVDIDEYKTRAYDNEVTKLKAELDALLRARLSQLGSGSSSGAI